MTFENQILEPLFQLDVPSGTTISNDTYNEMIRVASHALINLGIKPCDDSESQVLCIGAEYGVDQTSEAGITIIEPMFNFKSPSNTIPPITEALNAIKAAMSAVIGYPLVLLKVRWALDTIAEADAKAAWQSRKLVCLGSKCARSFDGPDLCPLCQNAEAVPAKA